MERAASSWRRFWFAPTDMTMLAVLRIAYAALVLGWAATLVPDLGAFFARDGLVGPTAAGRAWWEWSLLDVSGSAYAVAGVFVALVAAAAALLVGWHARLSAAVVFIAMTTLARTDPFVFNSGDALLRLLGFYLVLGPSGARFSLDRRRALAAGRPWPSLYPAWPLRLVQIQLSVMYAGAVASKLRGATWRDGSAVAYALQLDDLTRFAAPDVLLHSPLAAAVATYGTLLAEAALAVLVWPRRTRVAALCLGVALHVSIDAVLRVGFFSFAVVVAYLSFIERPMLAAHSRRRVTRARRRRALSA